MFQLWIRSVCLCVCVRLWCMCCYWNDWTHCSLVGKQERGFGVHIGVDRIQEYNENIKCVWFIEYREVISSMTHSVHMQQAQDKNESWIQILWMKLIIPYAAYLDTHIYWKNMNIGIGIVCLYCSLPLFYAHYSDVKCQLCSRVKSLIIFERFTNALSIFHSYRFRNSQIFITIRINSCDNAIGIYYIFLCVNSLFDYLFGYQFKEKYLQFLGIYWMNTVNYFKESTSIWLTDK